MAPSTSGSMMSVTSVNSTVAWPARATSRPRRRRQLVPTAQLANRECRITGRTPGAARILHAQAVMVGSIVQTRDGRGVAGVRSGTHARHVDTRRAIARTVVDHAQ